MRFERFERREVEKRFDNYDPDERIIVGNTVTTDIEDEDKFDPDERIKFND